ncbi:peptidase S8/S53 domain-containing protein [Rhodocollybia butyracea]|uniref:Peptidase S8/S53 domain-containing protein n=1 Tax=Rhodocollybia butyracea TaxID=206335 RepID=A0A9P5PB13_9AGAR|nr:peptidase S8/S53 domain-containing protein [Rhodocollybia butyracea]
MLATEDFIGRKEKDPNLRAVMNISWIIRHSPERKGEKAIEEAIAQGIHVVYAAGNEHQDQCSPSSPKRHVENVGQIYVSGIIPQAPDDHPDKTQPWPMSFQWRFNYGNCVDLVAPGEPIVCASAKGGTFNHAGTSFAAPLVAGTVAAILSTPAGRDLTPAQMKATIMDRFTIPGVVDVPDGSPDKMLVITELLHLPHN